MAQKGQGKTDATLAAEQGTVQINSSTMHGGDVFILQHDLLLQSRTCVTDIREPPEGITCAF